MLAVPRNQRAPIALEAMAPEPAEGLFHSVGHQNPTGTDMNPRVAFRVLQAAERHNFVIVKSLHLRPPGAANATVGDARPTQSGDLCAQLLEDVVRQLAGGFHRLFPVAGEPARRH